MIDYYLEIIENQVKLILRISDCQNHRKSSIFNTLGKMSPSTLSEIMDLEFHSRSKIFYYRIGNGIEQGCYQDDKNLLMHAAFQQ